MSNYRAIFLKRATEIHTKRYDYNGLPLSFTYKDWIDIGCSKHGIFKQKARTHVTGSGCPQCAREQREQVQYSKNRHTKDQFIEKARKRHGDFYDCSNTEYLGQMKRVTIVCPLHGSFEMTANNHVHGTGCSKCKRSRGEVFIQQWLDEHCIHNPLSCTAITALLHL